MEEGKVADQSAGEVDVLATALGDLGLEPEPAKAVKSEASESDSDLSQDEEDKPESAEDPAEDVSEADDTKSEAEEEQDEDEESEDDVPREKIQRRIDKLTAARKSAEEKATALAAEAEEAKAKVAEYEAQLNEAARPVLSPTADNPLADVDTQDALDAKIKSAQEVRRWALRNTDGATVKKPDGSEVYLDADQIKDYLIKADDVLTLHAPARQQWLAQRQPAVEAAKNLFPDIFRKGTPMHQAFTATVKQAPELLKLPQAEYWVGLALLGEQTLMAKQGAEAAKAKAAKKVSSSKEIAKTPTPAQPVSAAKSSTSSKGTKALRALRGDSMDDIESFVASALL
jgi:hypothetical protein